METKRSTALMDLKRLAENLQNCTIALPDRTWVDELGKMYIWANNEGTMSSLPEINKRMEDIKLWVRYWLNTFCLFVPFQTWHVELYVGITI